MSKGKLIGAVLVWWIALSAIEFISENSLLVWKILLVGAALLAFWVHQNNTDKKEERAYAEMIKAVTRSDFLKGKIIASEIGWVRVSGCKNTEVAEHKLKAQAGKLGANGLIKFHWTQRKESYVAGRGKKGNPYYKNRTLYDAEGVAVKWSKEIESPLVDRENITPRRWEAGWVALDGNNIFGSIYEQSKDIDSSFATFRTFLIKLEQSPYKFHLFWDGKFIKFLHAVEENSRGKPLKDVLIEKLGVDAKNLTISDNSQRIDDLIVPWAHAKNSVIVTRDKFSKPNEDTLINSKAVDMRAKGKILKHSVIAGDIIVPELVAI